jgi:TRAP-type uncharacterized transport system substrate-binding protein
VIIARTALMTSLMLATLVGLPPKAGAQGIWPFNLLSTTPAQDKDKAAPKAKEPPPPAAAAKPPAAKPPVKARAPLTETAPAPAAPQRTRDAVNQWVVGLAGGRVEGTPLRLTAEIADIADDGDNLRVVPIVTRGVFDNLADILYLRGVDGAIVYGDAMEHYKATQKIANIENQVAYVANLFVAEMHVLARPGINSLKDLAGKKVNFNTPGTAAAFTGPLVFDRLGIGVVKQFEPHREVMAALSTSSDVAALVFVTTKPAVPIAQPAWPAGFKLIRVDYTSALEDFYLPAYLDHTEYPNLIPQGQKVATIAVPVILAVANAAPDTDQFRRLARFVDRFVDQLPLLQKLPFDPGWKSVNLTATVPGWKRFAAMQQKLDQLGSVKPRSTTSSTSAPPPAIDVKLARQQAARAAPNDPAEQDRLFLKFLEWNQSQAR